MPEPPRRRRSPSSPQQRRTSREGNGILPTIALGVGVVVAGLGIGAFLSALQSKSAGAPGPAPSGVLPVVTPVAQPSRGPVAIATLVGHPSPTPTPEPTDTPEATDTPISTATPAATTTPSAPARATAAPPRAVPTPVVVTPVPAAHAVATLPSYAEHEPARPAERPAEGFGAQAQATVRRYLDAIISGDENTAYGAFGVSPGDPNIQLTEQGFLDSGARITALRTRHVDATGATIEAELSTARGAYEATYHVSRGPNGPVIDQHDYIKV
jgi:cytoskeletal protein RodZ